ncbi:MAG: hypothetical protein ACTSPM_00345 [Candidatus Heimdallarchaeota archaeon]
MRKKTMIGILSILLCILILPTSPIRGEIFKINDETADLVHYHHPGTNTNPGPNVHSEIDIESLQINGEEIAVSFVAPPIVDEAIFYFIRIFWLGDDTLGNYTKCYLDGDDNYVHTFIEDSSGVEITDIYEYDVISIVGSSLIIPLYNISLITHMFDPHIAKVWTSLTVTAEEEGYEDNLDYVTGTFPFPGFTNWITIGGISLIVMIGIIVKKKKN